MLLKINNFKGQVENTFYVFLPFILIWHLVKLFSDENINITKERSINFIFTCHVFITKSDYLL